MYVIFISLISFLVYVNFERLHDFFTEILSWCCGSSLRNILKEFFLECIMVVAHPTLKEKNDHIAIRLTCGMLFSFQLYKLARDVFCLLVPPVLLWHTLHIKTCSNNGGEGNLTVPLEGPELALNFSQPNKYFVY